METWWEVLAAEQILRFRVGQGLSGLGPATNLSFYEVGQFEVGGVAGIATFLKPRKTEV